MHRLPAKPLLQRLFLPVAGFAVAATLAFSATPAHATLWEWTWDGNGAAPNGAGDPLAISASFDDATDAFTWSVTFDDDTDGFTLVVSPGPNPKGSPDELAMLYMNRDGDLAAYLYNGFNGAQSHLNPGVVIESAIDPTWLNNVSVDTVTNSSGRIIERTFNIDIDASGINAFGAAQQDPAFADYTGVAFDQEIGVWFHWYNNINIDFTSAGGVSDCWLHGDNAKHGWLDLSNRQAVPEPGSAFLVLLSSATFVLRRRRGN